MAPRSGSTTPAYVSIAAALRDRIAVDGLSPHTLLPSERELCEEFGVSRMTARHALTLLENEGAVYRRPPRGTFVAEPRVTFRIGSFSDEITRVGLHPGAQVLWSEEQTASTMVAEALDLEMPARVNALQRLRYADAEPIAIETTYFAAEVTPGLLDGPLDGSIWAVLAQRYGVVATDARATLQSIVIDDSSCGRLGVRTASTGILLERRTFDADGRCFEFARDVYRADRATFEVSAAIPRAPR